MTKHSHWVAALAATLVITAAPITPAEANTSWRGPNRDGLYPQKGLLSDWPQNGPKLALTIGEIGDGYSSPTVTADRIYVSGMIDSTGYLFAYDTTGKLLWKAGYGPEWGRSYSGVRGSPLIAGDKVYMESGTGRVVCLIAASGKEIWAVDMVKTFGALPTKWGHAETLLLVGNKLICTPGGTGAAVAALDPATGKTIWTTTGIKQMAGYCSPVLAKHANKELLVTMLSESIIGIDPVTGKLLWQHPHKTDHGVNPNTPIYTNGNIIYASGYGNGAGMLRLSGDATKVTEVWREPMFDVQMGGTVLLDNMLYGFGHKNRGLHSLNITTGKIAHTLPHQQAGAVISAEGLLYCYGEDGRVSLVNPSGQKMVELGSFAIELGQGPHWAHPVINNGKLYIRHGTYLMVYTIKK